MMGKKLRTKFLASLFATALLLTFIPTDVLHAETLVRYTDVKTPYEYDDEGKLIYEEKSTTNYKRISSLADKSGITLSSGWWVLDANKTFKNTITVSGDVHLILDGFYTLNADGGIYVSYGSTFTTYGWQTDGDGGTINAKPGENGVEAAGIGGIKDKKSGSIMIKGGDIHAVGGEDCAGIGGASGSASGFAKIEILGGNVDATGTDEAAGIGAGYKNANNNLGDIVIHAGNVTATASNKGAGIGGCNGGKHGGITINGGVVRAFSKSKSTGGGAGIGSGDGADCSSIYIYGGDIESNWQKLTTGGAGIGSGDGGDLIGRILIAGGNIKAYANNGAGIGSGDGGDIDETRGFIDIQGGNIQAISYGYGAGIGGGESGESNNISIAPPNTAPDTPIYVYASSNTCGAGIGSGGSYISQLSFPADNGSVLIKGANTKVVAIGGSSINGGGAGIGGGRGGNGGTVVIDAAYVEATGRNGGAGIGGGDSDYQIGGAGADVTITNNATVIAKDERTRSAPIGAGGSDSDSGNITFDDNLMASTGQSATDNITTLAQTREEQCQNKNQNYAKIEPCTHKILVCAPKAEGAVDYRYKHVATCGFCDSYSFDEDHVIEGGECIKCHLGLYSATFVYNNGIQEDRVVNFPAPDEEGEEIDIVLPGGTGQAVAPAPAIPAEDMIFSRWENANGERAALNQDGTYSLVGSETFYARYVKNKKLSYQPNNGDNTFVSYVDSHDEAVLSAEPGNAPTGKTFAGWIVTGSDRIQTHDGSKWVDIPSGSLVEAGAKLRLWGDVSVTGKWEGAKQNLTVYASTKDGAIAATAKTLDSDDFGSAATLGEYIESNWAELKAYFLTDDLIAAGYETDDDYHVIPLALNSYLSWSDVPVWSSTSELYNAPLGDGNNDLVVYIPLVQKIASVSADFSKVNCGDVSITPSKEGTGYSHDYAKQTNKPQISLETGAKYKISETNGSPYWKISTPATAQATTINFGGNNKYNAYLELEPMIGFIFDDNVVVNINTSDSDIISTSQTTKSLINVSAQIPVVHSLGNWYTHTEATCSAKGEERRKCETCTYYESRQTDINPDNHAWGEWTTIRPASEAGEGLMQRVCAHNASHVQTEVIPWIHTHVLTHVDAKAETCTEAGNKEYWICDGGNYPCGATFADAEGQERATDIVIDAPGHNWSDWEEVTDEYGHNHVRSCERCHEVERIPIADPDCEHLEKEVTDETAEIPATCTDAGRGEFYRCTNSDCKALIVTINDVDTVVTKDNKDVLMEALTILPLGHDLGEWEVVIPATIHSMGMEKRNCTRCDWFETRDIPVLEPTQYNNVEGDGLVWYKGSGENATFVFKRAVDDGVTFEHFEKAMIDNANLDANNYDASSGSLVLSLHADFMEGLDVGNHVLTASFDDGNSPSASFSIRPAEENPDNQNSGIITPDTSDKGIIPWLAIMVGAVGVSAVAVIKRKPKNE